MSKQQPNTKQQSAKLTVLPSDRGKALTTAEIVKKADTLYDQLPHYLQCVVDVEAEYDDDEAIYDE